MARLVATLVGLALALAWAGPALARVHQGCGRTEVKLADAALDAAAGLTLDAAVAVGETPEYARWFGPWSPARSEGVRRDLKAMQRALAADALTIVCHAPASVDCKDGIYAFVPAGPDPDLHLCPAVFGLPSLRDAAVGRGDQEAGTREGAIVHEVSHFPSTADTLDHCYGRTECADMAVRDPIRAVRNAESFQFYTEDVHLALMLAKEE